MSDRACRSVGHYTQLPASTSSSYQRIVASGGPGGRILCASRQNQCAFISRRNETEIGNPERSPITLSIPQLGQSAVCPSPEASRSVHSAIRVGWKT